MIDPSPIDVVVAASDLISIRPRRAPLRLIDLNSIILNRPRRKLTVSLVHYQCPPAGLMPFCACFSAGGVDAVLARGDDNIIIFYGTYSYLLLFSTYRLDMQVLLQKYIR